MTPNGPAVYRNLALDEVLSEYQPALHVPSLQDVLEQYRTDGEHARKSIEHRRLAYGSHPDEWMWFVPSRRRDAPLLVFIHGGYWRRLSADDGCLLSDGAARQGWAVASLNYTLCPHATLETLIDQCRRAVAFLCTEAPRLGVDPQRIFVSGHSAGGHLAGMVAITDPRPAGYILVSGVFDITPIVHTPINDDVRMSADEARRWSPMEAVPSRPGTKCLTTWGELETSEFRRQSIEWAQRWSAVPGNDRAVHLEAAGRHHFDVVYDLVEPLTPLGAAVRSIIDA